MLSTKQSSKTKLGVGQGSTSITQQQKEMFNILTQKYLDNVLSREDGISELEVKFGTKDIKKITKIIDACNLTKKETKPISTCSNPDAKITANKHCISVTKPESNFVAMSQGEHLLRLDKECTKIDKSVVNTQRTPFVGNN